MENSIFVDYSKCNNFTYNIAAYYNRSKTHHEMKMHRHDRIEFMYVTKGFCHIETPKKTLILKKGHVIFIDAGFWHTLYIPPQEDCRMMNIELVKTNNSNFGSLTDLYSNSEFFKFFIDQKNACINLFDSSNILDAMHRIIIAHDRYHDDVQTSLLILPLFHEFSKLYYDEIHQQNIDPYTNRALNYIHQNYAYPIDVQSIASKLKIHPNHLHRIFKNHTGETIISYITKLRLERATYLLENTKLSILDISMQTGFNSRQYFSRIFKKNKGITPMQYRETNTPYITNIETKTESVL